MSYDNSELRTARAIARSRIAPYTDDPLVLSQIAQFALAGLVKSGKLSEAMEIAVATSILCGIVKNGSGGVIGLDDDDDDDSLD